MKMISYKKMGKKARKEQNARARVLWGRSPVTRKPAKSTAYDRKKVRKELLWAEYSEPSSGYRTIFTGGTGK